MDVKAFLKKYRWMLLGVVIVVLGYQFGKDLASKHNAQDEVKREALTQ